ncbi:hypothetical protein Sxan_22550 [Streptomyces xanthophaeus]|uniref:Uncharacterized protein n=1 Tax=Streptomyces xanthophaeus TaxID=67385 RepID=A0A919LCA2_9ACTN|nr:hypothetical protein Sxan_22550 [Streptomyces xanthophaeus]
MISRLNRGYAVRSIEVTTHPRLQTMVNITTNDTEPNGWRAGTSRLQDHLTAPFGLTLAGPPERVQVAGDVAEGRPGRGAAIRGLHAADHRELRNPAQRAPAAQRGPSVAHSTK